MSRSSVDDAEESEDVDDAGTARGGRGAESTGEWTSLYGSDAPPESQRAALLDGRVPISVYGLGKLGLPVAAALADLTGNVTGVDVDPDVVSALGDGDCPVTGEPGLGDLVSELIERDAFSATSDPGEVTATVHVVVVPTFVDEEGRPDLSALRSAVQSIGRTLSPGDVVFVESTVPPGTCRWTVAPLLGAVSGLDRGEFGLACCPERTQSGQALGDIRAGHPRVVGGVDAESERVARLVYGELSSASVVVAEDATTAEVVKVFEGVYRDVNIALANEFARMADDLRVDVTDAIEIANTQPYCDIHDPGPGVGGHCIPYYPLFLLDAVRVDGPLVEQARSINESMPAFTVRKLAELLRNRGVGVGDASVAILGVTYRPGVAETRESPAHDVARILSTVGADVCGVDPMLDRIDTDRLSFPVVAPGRLRELAGELDAAVVVTPHEEFSRLDWEELPSMVVVDGRNALDLSGTHHHVHVLGDGRP